MSTSAGAVLVLPPGQRPADVHAALPPRLRAATHDSAARWDVTGLADGHLVLEASPIGFDLLVLRCSGNAALEPPTIRGWLDDLAQLGERLGAYYGFVTRYETELTTDRLEQNVLLPLLMDEGDTIETAAFDEILIAPRRRGPAMSAVP